MIIYFSLNTLSVECTYILHDLYKSSDMSSASLKTPLNVWWVAIFQALGAGGGAKGGIKFVGRGGESGGRRRR